MQVRTAISGIFVFCSLQREHAQPGVPQLFWNQCEGLVRHCHGPLSCQKSAVMAITDRALRFADSRIIRLVSRKLAR